MTREGASWPRRVFQAVLLLLAVAIGARLAAALLAPLVPLLITIAALLVVLAIALSWWRR
jgi:hypothetical protein